MADVGRHVRSSSRRSPVGSIAAVVIALVVGGALGPVAVQAANNIVTIVGPGATQQSSGAKVTNGRLQVGDGKGALTINGSTSARPAIPAHPVYVRSVTNGQSPTTLFQPNAGATRLAITSLTITNQGSTRDQFELDLRPTCSPGDVAQPLYQVQVPLLTTMHLSLPTPLVVGHLPGQWCIQALSATQLMTLTVVGFTA